MTNKCGTLFGIVAATVLVLLAGTSPSMAQVAPNDTDSLYVGDAADNTVERFGATTGQFLGTFVQDAQLQGPRGILHLSNGHFLVSNQNAGLPISGEIDQFDSN